MHNSTVLFRIAFLFFLLSCQEDSTEAIDSADEADLLIEDTPLTWQDYDMDSMVVAHNDSLLFMNYWSGMSPEEFELITDFNVHKEHVTKSSTKTSSAAMITDDFESSLQVDYMINDSIFKLHFFYLAPIKYEETNKKNYKAHRELRESPNGGIVLFSGLKDENDNLYIDDLFHQKYSQVDGISVSTRGGCCYSEYSFYDSLYVGFTMYTQNRMYLGTAPTIIFRSESDGNYLKRNKSIHPTGYNKPEFDRGDFFGED